MEAQVSRDLVAVLHRLDAGALEDDRGELLDVEEIGTAQMIVAFRVVRVDAVRINAHAERTLAGIVGIDGEVPGEPVEATRYPRKSQMRDLETDSGMHRIHNVIVRSPRRG